MKINMTVQRQNTHNTALPSYEGDCAPTVGDHIKMHTEYYKVIQVVHIVENQQLREVNIQATLVK